MALPTDPDPLRRALNRLTFGARDTDVALANSMGGLAAWMADQFAVPAGDDPDLDKFVNSQTMRINYAAPAVNDTRGMWSATDEVRPLLYLNADPQILWEVAVEAGSTYATQERTRIRQELIGATWIRNAHSRYQLREFMTDFWNNHFNIGKAESELATAMLPLYDRAAIRPYVFGNFRQMLEANASSPAMLIYLDNWLSTATTPNENYGREIMELHTLGQASYYGTSTTAPPINADGVANGYTDQDVIQASRALSGWTIKNGQRNAGKLIPSTGEFFYNPGQHNNNAGKILNVDFSTTTGDQAQGRKLIDLLAYHLRTPQFIVPKLARRIFGDSPPASVIDRGVTAWNANRTDPQQIRKVLEAMILGGGEIFGVTASKIRRPYERLIALARTTNTVVNITADMTTALDAVNDGPYAWQGPNGRPDIDSYWLSSGIMLTTWNLLIAFPNWATNVTTLTNQTPQSALGSAISVVEYWVGRMVGYQLDPSRMTALVNDQGGTSGVPAVSRANNATRTENALRRLVSMIATAYEFTVR